MLGTISIAAASALIIAAVLVYLNERHQLFHADAFPTAIAKWLAYVWLALLLVLIAALVAYSSTNAMTELQVDQLTFWSLFNFHLILVVFLIGWWVLSGMPPIRRFLNLHHTDTRQALLLGLGVGVVGWAITILVGLVIGAILLRFDLLPKNLQPSPLIPWMANLPAWQKATLIASAMTVEEAFFRGWLQKRVGLLASTALFALGHSGYGQPLMLIGVTVVSLVIGYTFYRTRNLVPCIVAHGVFDAIQLFVVVPFALRYIQASPTM